MVTHVVLILAIGLSFPESKRFAFASFYNCALSYLIIITLQLLANLTSPDYATYIRSLISDNQTYNDYEHYGANFSVVEDHGTAHVSVLHENGDAVAATSTINL